MSALPTDVMAAAAAFGAGRICLVIGAGTSIPAPTSLLAARATSLKAHGQLVRDGVLDGAECPDPGDLSELANSVIAKTGGQHALVARMEPERMRNASSNAGHRCAVALLLEGIVRSVVSLNFDTAIGHALSELGTGARVATVKGPEDWASARERSVIYLHRNIDSPWETLVLRPADLNSAWEDGWQRVVAIASLSAPVCLFAGLGSPATVLVESVKHVQATLGASEVFLATPGALAGNAFGEALGIDLAHYIPLGWNELMLALEERTLAEHRDVVEATLGTVIAANGWPNEDVASLLDRLTGIGLVALGRVRGMWIEQSSDYLPVGTLSATELMVEIIHGLAALETLPDVSLVVTPDRAIEVRRADRLIGKVAIASGRGVLNHDAAAAAARKALEASAAMGLLPAVTLVAGSPDPHGPASTPENIAGSSAEGSLVDPQRPPTTISFAEIRSAPGDAFARLEAAA